MKCKICAANADLFGNAMVMDKYSVSYFRCGICGFIQVEEPYWLEEAYSRTITRSDIGLVGRNLQMADVTRKLILTCFDPGEEFIDYGGGYGLFVRLMRDGGFQFYRYDPLCENLFAEGFDAPLGSRYSLLTAWEVFEHLTNPLAEIERMLAFSRTLFFSTALLPSAPKPLGDWWYYGLEHGQHVAFYSSKTLRVIADIFHLKLHFSNGAFHLLSSMDISPFLVKITFNPRLRLLRKFFAKRKPESLLAQDYHKVTGKKLQ